MNLSFCRTGALLSLLLILETGGRAGASEPLEAKGYYKHFLSLTDAHDSFQNAGLTDKDVLVDSLQRLRLEVDLAPQSWWDLNVAYEIRAGWGDSVGVRKTAEETGSVGPWRTPSARASFFDFDHVLIDENRFTLTHVLDRFRLRLQTDRIQLRLGRQAVSWGSGLLWTPSDFFVSFAPDAIDVDEKPGVDVVRFLFTPDYETTLDLIVEPLDTNETLSVDSEDSSLAARAVTHLGEYDLALSGGYLASDRVLGMDFSGYLKDAGLHGDVVYTWVDESNESDYLRGVLGMDYSFASPWNPYAALEYFYNGLGTDDADQYLERRRDRSVQRAVDRGTAFNLGRNYLGSIFRLSPTARVTFSSTTLWNLDDGSLLEFVTLSRSLSDRAELIVGANFGVGPSGTEFGGFTAAQAGTEFGYPEFVYAYYKGYF